LLARGFEMHHQLKTAPYPYQLIKEGRKNVELRVDDRPFALGDTVHLILWENNKFCGRSIQAVIGWLMDSGYHSYIPKGYVMFGLADISAEYKFVAHDPEVRTIHIQKKVDL